jgi:large subunit ribosomal protein L6
MSNIGKQHINIPSNVKINITNNNLTVEGKNGKLNYNIPSSLIITYNNNKLLLNISDKNGYHRSIKSYYDLWGANHTIINNIIKGVNQGFIIRLQLVGIGYRAKIENNILILKLGYSHLIEFKIPDNVKINIIKPNLLSLFGIDIKEVSKIAAVIRKFKTPEPYKGKGIRYVGEIVRRKEGKKK